MCPDVSSGVEVTLAEVQVSLLLEAVQLHAAVKQQVRVKKGDSIERRQVLPLRGLLRVEEVGEDGRS